MGMDSPRVGLVSIGEEDSKGNQLVLETNERLRRQTGINFIGNVEGKDLTQGIADVVVTDGFTGNVILKAAEGTADYIVHELRQALSARLPYRLRPWYCAPRFGTCGAGRTTGVPGGAAAGGSWQRLYRARPQ